MSELAGIGAAGPGRPAGNEETLRQLSQELEGMFIRQLFQAMRSSVPEGGLFERSSGEMMFTSLMDDQLSTLTAEKSERGLGDALYRQLVKRLQADRPERSE